jgi:hypothetical protein
MCSEFLMKIMLLILARNKPKENCCFTAKIQYRKFETTFPGKELRGYSHNSYIHVPVSVLYIPLIGLPILLQENRK